VIHGVDVLTADEHVTRHRIALRQANLLLDQRIFVFPSANLLVTIPEIGNKLNVHGVDFTELMEESGADYLAVLSQPPATVSQGDSFSYQMDVRSKKAGVKYELSSGPDGMKVSKEGLVTWTVPAIFPERETVVIISITDATGQERVHTFPLRIVGQAKD
jgi:hypothetical protein